MSSRNARGKRPNLPTEMWLEVLQYLGVGDLNSVRQSCRQFYNLCNRIYYENREIVFYGNINTNAEIISLADKEYKIQNLKFVDVRLLDDSILSFFHTQGANIRSLVFRDCTLASGLLINIILCCEHLRSFHFEVDCSLRGEEDVKPIFKDFSTLRKVGIIRQHVSSFTFRLNMVKFAINETFDFFTVFSFSDFFAVFPIIKELDLACDAMVEDAEISNVGPSLSFIYDQLFKMRHRLEKLRFHLRAITSDPSNSSVTSWNTIANIDMEKLDELSLNWHDCRCPSIAAYTRILEHLTEFKCVIAHELTQDISAGAFIQSLLNSAPKLRFLTILRYTDNGYPHMILDKDCFQALVRSRLRALNIGIFSKTNVTDDSLENSLQPNYSLRNLKFGNLLPRMKNSLSVLFTKYFQSIEIFDTAYVRGNVFENILKFQKNLRNLSVRNYSSSSSKFVVFESSRMLDHLTCLSLVDCSRANLCKEILTCIKFPKLQSLAIVVRVNCDMSSLLTCIRKFINLEYLEIHWEIGRTPLSLSALYRDLPKLRYLIYSNDCYVPFDTLDYYRIFEECPTLRIFMHKVDDYVYHRYVKYFNPNEKYEYEVVSLGSAHTSTTSRPLSKLIYEGIPQKYPPFYWNNKFSILCETRKLIPGSFFF